MFICCGSLSCLFWSKTTRLLCISRASHYKTLDVSQTATSQEIKQAYLKKCKEFHPDVNKEKNDMHRKFVAVNEAYQTLSDSKKRTEYDSKMHNNANYQNSHYTSQSSSFYKDNENFTDYPFKHRSANNSYQNYYDNDAFKYGDPNWNYAGPYGQSAKSKKEVQKQVRNFFLVFGFTYILFLWIFVAEKRRRDKQFGVMFHNPHQFQGHGYYGSNLPTRLHIQQDGYAKSK